MILHLTERFARLCPGGGRSVTVERRCLERTGRPTADEASEAVEALLVELGPRGDDELGLCLLLPGRAVQARILAADVPIRHRVTQRDIEQALATIDAAAHLPGHAVLQATPSVCRVDGGPVLDDPVGKTAEVLSIEAAALSVPFGRARQFETAVAKAGGQLVSALAPHPAVLAAMPTGQSGGAIHIGWGETLVVTGEAGRLLGAGTVPIGMRHLVSDVMKLGGLPGGVARDVVEETLAAPRTARKDDLDLIIDARLDELSERCAAALGSLPVPVASGKSADAFHLFGEETIPHRVKDAVAAALPDWALADDRESRTDLAALAATLPVERWALAPAAVAEGEQRAGGVAGWLKRHF